MCICWETSDEVELGRLCSRNLVLRERSVSPMIQSMGLSESDLGMELGRLALQCPYVRFCP